MRILRLRKILLSSSVVWACVFLIACSKPQYRKTTLDVPYPYNEAYKVEVLSYYNRISPPLIEGEPVVKGADSFSSFGALKIPKATIKERLLLTNEQRDSLFSLLNKPMCTSGEIVFCYNPRHAFIFYDSVSKPFAHIEVCLECARYETSPYLEVDFCFEKVKTLKDLLQSFGIEYFGPEGV